MDCILTQTYTMVLPSTSLFLLFLLYTFLCKMLSAADMDGDEKITVAEFRKILDITGLVKLS